MPVYIPTLLPEHRSSLLITIFSSPISRMKLSIRISPGLVLTGLSLVLAFSACNYPTQRQPTSTPDILPTLVATLLSTPPLLREQPPTPMRLLTVCLGKEPTSLFPYGDSSLAAKAVHDAIYDSPVDWVNYAPQPGILAKIPSAGRWGCAPGAGGGIARMI